MCAHALCVTTENPLVPAPDAARLRPTLISCPIQVAPLASSCIVLPVPVVPAIATVVAAAVVPAPDPTPAIGWSQRADAPTAIRPHDPSDDQAIPALSLQTPSLLCKPTQKVFGFLPYWSGTTNIRWDLLSHVGIFSLGVDASGNITNTIGWPWTNTINTARNNGVKVILTVTNFNPSQVLSLLTSTTARSNFFSKLRTQILAGADGVCIDFEGSTGNGWPGHVPGFLQAMREYFDQQRIPCEIHIATPAVNWNNAWNFSAVAAQADALFIMGYDFYGSWSTTSGPSAPLFGGSLNVDNTMRTQYASVLTSTPHKMILGTPWYGNQWDTATSAAYSSALAFTQSITYANAAAAVGTYGRQWDAVSRTPWYRWQDATWNQVWFDDAESLGVKYARAKTYGLGGIGVWALGYQGSTAAMWDAITAHFPALCPCPADLNNDRVIDDADFVLFSDAYQMLFCPETGLCPGDLNNDALIDDSDFVIFATAYNELNCP